MASWLGTAFPDGTRPDLLDLAPPPLSVATGVRQAGGLAFHFPIQDDLALRCGATRSKLRAVVTLLRPRHLWLTLPLHPFGGWGRLESARGKDTSPSFGCGRRCLAFLLELCRIQASLGGTFSVLHHLTSTAWREPAAVALLASTPRVRLLLGPAPGLPFCLKTTLPSLLPLPDPSSGPALATSVAQALLPEARFAPEASLRRAGHTALTLPFGAGGGGGGGGGFAVLFA